MRKPIVYKDKRYCPYCGGEMEDLGDSWVCNDADCTYDVPLKKVDEESQNK